jgi:hypothetical protein
MGFNSAFKGLNIIDYVTHSGTGFARQRWRHYDLVLIVTSYFRLPVALFYPSEGPTKRYPALAHIVCFLGACYMVCQSKPTICFQLNQPTRCSKFSNLLLVI